MKKYFNMPIKITLVYSLLTIYLYEFGVMAFDYVNKGLVWVFLIVVNIFIYAGYWMGIHSPRKRTMVIKKRGKFVIMKIYTISFYICLLTFLPAFFIETRTYTLNIRDLVNKLIIGFQNSTLLYNDIREASNVTGIWKYINYIIVITGFVRWTFYPLTIYLWTQVKKIHKIFFFVFLFFYCAAFITTGTTAGVFTTAYIVLTPFLMKWFQKCYLQHRNRIKRIKKKKQHKLFVTMSIILVAFACIYMFGNNMKSRQGTLYVGHGDFSAFPWNFMPESIKPVIYWMTGYLVQGYDNMAYCIDLPFTSTFGLGGSWFTIQNFSELLDIDILRYTYLGKAEQLFGIGAYQRWHSVYTWIANDVSFVGVPLVIFVLFYLMAQAWRDFLEENDPFAFVFETIMGFFVLYISANNTVFSHTDTMFAFYITLYLWKKYRNKFDYWSVTNYEETN